MSFIVKNTTFPGLLDLIAPYSCRGCGRIGEPLCKRCKNYIIASQHNFCPTCRQPIPTNGLCLKCKNPIPLFTIDKRDSLVGKLIHDYKYRSVRPLGLTFAEILNATLPNIPGLVAIAPLPTATHHVRQRALDHTLLISKKLAKLRGTDYRVEKILSRAKNTVQVGSGRQSRLHQATLAYITTKSANPNTTYILLDDVYTTGASMHAATKKLQQAGAKRIIQVVLAIS